MKKSILLFAGLSFLIFKSQAQTVIDIDGNIYNTVTIGAQTWMQENLKVIHYCDGAQIPNDTSATLWYGLSTGARCYYNNDSSANAPVYGALYNWYAIADSRKLCPIGWHVPSNGEWNILEKYLDNTVDTNVMGWVGTNIGGKLKETTHWTSPNTGATNSSGFTALPGGCRKNYGLGYAYYNAGDGGSWWSATEKYSTSAWSISLGYLDAGIFRSYNFKTDGYSIRCLNGDGSSIEDINYQDKLEIYPNPAIDRIYIDYTEKQNVKIQIWDVVGECVLQSKLTNSTNEIDISSLSKGIYIIKLTGIDWIVQRKLTKE